MQVLGDTLNTAHTQASLRTGHKQSLWNTSHTITVKHVTYSHCETRHIQSLWNALYTAHTHTSLWRLTYNHWETYHILSITSNIRYTHTLAFKRHRIQSLWNMSHTSSAKHVIHNQQPPTDSAHDDEAADEEDKVSDLIHYSHTDNVAQDEWEGVFSWHTKVLPVDGDLKQHYREADYHIYVVSRKFTATGRKWNSSWETGGRGGEEMVPMAGTEVSGDEGIRREVQMYVCVCGCAGVCACVCVSVHMYLWWRVCVCVCARVHLCMCVT